MTTTLTFFENIKLYVGFTDASSAALRELHPIAEPFFVPIVDDFYAAIEAHPGASGAITGGAAQIERLKQIAHPLDGQDAAGPPRRGLLRAARAHRAHARPHRAAAGVHVHGDGSDPRPPARRAAHQVRGRSGQGRADREGAQSDHGPRARDHARDLPRGSGDQAPQRRAAGNHRPVRRQHRPRAAQSTGRRGVVAVSRAPASRRAGGGAAAGRQAPGPHRQRGPAREQDDSRSPGSRPQSSAAPAPDRVAGACGERRGGGAAAGGGHPGGGDSAGPDRQHRPGPGPADPGEPADQRRPGDARAGPRLGGRETTPDGGTRLRVRDDGPGIPAQDRHRIFEALYTTKAKGSGLGLALCRRIMEAHEGTIELETSAAGASFLLFFPPRKADETPGTGAPA